MQYRVNVSKVLTHIGAELPILKSFKIPQLMVGEDVYDIKGPVQADLLLRNVGPEMLLTGSVIATLKTQCSRCLDDLGLNMDLPVSEIVHRHREPEDSPDDVLFPETYFLDGEELNLEPIVDQTLVLGVPLTPLCRPDCQGLCPNCGTNWNEGTCDCTVEVVDPRWDALKSLLDGKS